MTSVLNLAEFIISVESFNANINIPLIRRAYEFCDRAHAGQLRESGEPFVVHCLNVGLILAELHLDSDTIAAGLIHDVVEDTDITLDAVSKEFGDDIASLVDGITKLGTVEVKSRKEQQVEYFRKMLLSMARDIRVILIKLADRLHNMRTLEHLDPDRQHRIAIETRDVYAPLAHRFGIAKLKTELEDLSMKYRQPEIYAEIVRKLALTREEREAFIEMIARPIRKKLSEHGIKAEVTGRAKHIDSIHRKMQIHKVTFEQIADLFAMRIIVRTKAECYYALGLVHELFHPAMQKFADYIANPKPNNYQSLHTAIYSPGGRIVEIQIRTREMHYISENGIAAHWLYKEGRQQLDKADKQMMWLRDVLDWQKDMINPSEFLEYLKIDLFADDIFVYTPQGEIKHLPARATPLDFAFSIHTEVGLHCSGARVDDRLVPLDSRLESGNRVEILTSPHRHPSQDWLNIATTSQARSRIRRWLKQAGYDQAVDLGRELLERELKRIRQKLPPDDKLLEIAQMMSQGSAADLFAALGNGTVTTRQILSRLAPDEEEPAVTGEQSVDQVLDRFRTERGIKIEGVDNMMFRFAGCCQPIPGEEIIGYITRGRGVTIHRADCPFAQELVKQPERTVPVSWAVEQNQTFVVRLEVRVEPRKNILADITESIADSDTNVRGADISLTEASSAGTIVVEVKSLSQLERVLSKIKKVRGVISVHRKYGRGREEN